MTKYQELLKAVDSLPKEAIEKAKKEITRKGYDTTGYQYQFLVNVLNEVIGIGDWGFDYKILKEIEGKWGNGKGFWEITTEITAWIKVGTTDKKKVSFSCVGGHKSEMHADALKGAITNGFKKTVAFFGIGKKAYEGTIDDDYRPVPYQSTKEPNKQGTLLKPKPKGIQDRFKDALTSLGKKQYHLILKNHGFKSIADVKKKSVAELILVDMEQAMNMQNLVNEEEGND